MITCNRCQTKLSDLESAKGQCPHCHAPLNVATIDLLLPWKQMSIAKNECATDQTVELDTQTVAPTTSVALGAESVFANTIDHSSLAGGRI